MPPQPAPEPLREATRRFLRPLVGVDPAEVRVFRGPAARSLADALGADAAAAPGAVVLPPEVDETAPAGLGLIAHELSHVARARDPRFVPPLPLGPAPLVGADPEERLAGAVEGAVARVAAAPRPAPEAGPAAPALPAAQPAAPPSAPAADWGGLPAPWEPIPGAARPGPAAPAERRAPAPAPAPHAPEPASGPGPAPAPLRRADVERSRVPSPAPDTSPAPPPAAPEPDLDALARQVYAVLKQRLATERRRIS